MCFCHSFLSGVILHVPIKPTPSNCGPGIKEIAGLGWGQRKRGEDGAEKERGGWSSVCEYI